MTWLFWKALFAFVALPGTVAFAVPLLVIQPRWWERAIDRVGLIPLATGIVLLLWCVREFYVAGRGTLAPWAPPENLVTTGLYGLSRNPMYVAVLLLLFGWVIMFHSSALAVYAVAVAIAFHLRIVFGEEPWLARMHGEAWARYKADVPRWLGVRGTVRRTQ